VLENKIRLEGSDVDQLCEIVLDYVNIQKDGWTEIRSMKTRFNVDWDSTPDYGEYTLKRSVQDIIYFIGGEKDNFYDFFSYIVDKDRSSSSRYNSILKKYGYTVEDNGGKYILVPLTGETFQKEIEQLQGYIENNAPQKTLDHLKEAKEKFANNDFDGCLSECRIALESLTKNGNFARGITELVNLGTITDNKDPLRKDEGWLLKSIYGYDSTVGSHSSAGSSPATSEQAFMGLMITQSTMRFILAKLQEIKQQNVELREWDICKK
jgi:hypothetical protein